jgi:hypothetical protein
MVNSVVTGLPSAAQNLVNGEPASGANSWIKPTTIGGSSNEGLKLGLGAIMPVRFGAKPAPNMGTPNEYGVYSGSKTYAGDTYAALTRDQWNTYVSTFVPIENQLIKYATDPGVVTSAMSQASQNVNDAFNAQTGATARHLAGLGVTLTPEQQQAQQKAYGLSRGLADVGAQNLAGEVTRNRQQSILGNPAPVAGQTMMEG